MGPLWPTPLPNPNRAGLPGISLRNMQLFQLAHAEHRRAESMLSMTYTLAGATLDLPELVRRVMAFARDLTRCDRCSVYIADEQRRRLEAHHEGVLPEWLPGDVGIPGRVLAGPLPRCPSPGGPVWNF